MLKVALPSLGTSWNSRNKVSQPKVTRDRSIPNRSGLNREQSKRTTTREQPADSSPTRLRSPKLGGRTALGSVQTGARSSLGNLHQPNVRQTYPQPRSSLGNLQQRNGIARTLSEKGDQKAQRAMHPGRRDSGVSFDPNLSLAAYVQQLHATSDRSAERAAEQKNEDSSPLPSALEKRLAAGLRAKQRTRSVIGRDSDGTALRTHSALEYLVRSNARHRRASVVDDEDDDDRSPPPRATPGAPAWATGGRRKSSVFQDSSGLEVLGFHKQSSTRQMVVKKDVLGSQQAIAETIYRMKSSPAPVPNIFQAADAQSSSEVVHQENCPSCKNELTKHIMQGLTEDDLISRGTKCRKCAKLLSTVAATLLQRQRRSSAARDADPQPSRTILNRIILGMSTHDSSAQ
eukprot:CAMPEP_0202822116 /NCGR_PEP_ID=MMETSP1389-20130828/10845_1 /ASSEMBLY_ACC=CAM_ASM_000865 /TAXON_ID=302021 /ORGANISM="Rhodomonas sp., Strain CCMP768" /LENGTH=401 /DNA_ID=CAMNT_0049494979 /DNA_START=53 /DNA_END=1259 /DNA_ORIENTATION=+